MIFEAGATLSGQGNLAKRVVVRSLLSDAGIGIRCEMYEYVPQCQTRACASSFELEAEEYL